VWPQTAVPPNNSSCGIVWRPVLTVALLNNSGLQGTPAARRPSPRRSPTTVASPVSQYPGTCTGDSVYRQNDGAPALCAVACLLAVLTYGEALSDRIGSDRIVSRYFVCYRIVSYRVPYGCIVSSLPPTIPFSSKCFHILRSLSDFLFVN